MSDYWQEQALERLTKYTAEMNKLKPCPFCGTIATQDEVTGFIKCEKNHCFTLYDTTNHFTIRAEWNKRY